MVYDTFYSHFCVIIIVLQHGNLQVTLTYAGVFIVELYIFIIHYYDLCYLNGIQIETIV